MLAKFFLRLSAPVLTRFDYRAAQNVNEFIAISDFVRKRIKNFYDLDSRVIYPPVDLSDISISHKSEEFYLIVTQLVGYKRVDLAINACNQLKRRLVIVGEGDDLKRLQSMSGDTIEFTKEFHVSKWLIITEDVEHFYFLKSRILGSLPAKLKLQENQ